MQQGTLIAPIVFPRPWPPKTEILFFWREIDGAHVELSGDSFGRLTFSLYSNDATTRRYTFQPLQIDGSGRAVLWIVWSDTAVTMGFNKQEMSMKLETDAAGESFLLKTSDDPLNTGPLFRD